MAREPLVSVVLPAFNSAETLPRALAGVLAQTFRDLEVVVVDDGSSDDTAEIARQVADDRVRVVLHARNRGAAAARNTGVAEARGQLIAFHDADDVWLFDKLERQVAALAKRPDHVAVYTGALFYQSIAADRYGPRHLAVHRRPLPAPTLSGDMHAQVLAGNVFNLPTILMRREAFDAVGGFDPRIPANEDWEFSIRLAAHGPILFDPEPLYLSIHHLGTHSFDNKLSRSSRKAMLSFVFIVNKLKRRGVPLAALGDHCVTTASLLMRHGRFRASRRYLHAAWRGGASPRRVLPRLLLASLPRLHALLTGRAGSSA